MGDGDGATGAKSGLFGAVLALVTAIIVAGAGALFGHLATQGEARSAALDQGTGAARAYLVVLEQMQGGLDSDLKYREQLAPPIHDREWEISIADLKSLGVVLRPEALYGVERASQLLDLVFPASFHGEPPLSPPAFAAYQRHGADMVETDNVVRCAEIYLASVDRVLPQVPGWASGRVALRELAKCRSYPGGQPTPPA